MAILKIANAMDRSHKQKFKNIKAALKDKELLITIETEESMILDGIQLLLRCHACNVFLLVTCVNHVFRQRKA